MNTPADPPRYSLVKSILALLAGWAIGIGLMMLIRSMFQTPLASAIAQGVSFLGFFTGFYWLSEYFRWKRSGSRVLFQSRPFRLHLISAVVGAVALAVVTWLMER